MTHRNSALFCPQTLWVEPLVWAIFMIGVGGAWSPSAQAQITPDQTLGPESSIVTADHIRGRDSARIDGGAIRANVLFHSFEHFNVTEGQGVYFTNPVGIGNILSRVTGNAPSDIMGRLGVLGEANLFFLNPNGIMFGPHSSLDIRGSFIASTADRFTFANGMTFNAVNPNAAPLLTLNLVPGLQYGSQHGTPSGTSGAGAIATQGTLTTGQNLTLSGGNLQVQGQLNAGHRLRLHGLDTVTIRDTSATPFIASAGHDLTVQGNQAVDIFALNHPNSQFVAGGDLTLRSSGPVLGDAHYWSGGHFRIEQLDKTLAAWASPNDPVIRAIGDVSFDSYSGASLHILAGGSVTIPGGIEITEADATNSLTETAIPLSNGTTIDIDGRTIPTLDIRAGASVNTSEMLGADAPTNTATGAASTPANITLGEIDIAAGDGDGAVSVFLSTYNPEITSNGTATGSIDVNRITVVGDVVMDAGGDITITGPNVDLNSAGGTMTLLASDRIQLTNLELNSEGGDIILSAGDNIALDTVAINSGTFDTIADTTDFDNFVTDIPGDISLIATNDIDITQTAITADGGGINALSGNAGNVTIRSESGSINVTSQSEISSSARSQGFAGAITVDAPRGSIALTSSAVASNLEQDGNSDTNDFSGDGGAGIITLRALDAITLRNNATVSAATSAAGEASNQGNLSLTTEEGSITLNNSTLSTLAEGGFAGNITLMSGDRLIIRNDSTLTSGTAAGFTSIESAAGAGLINLTASNNIKISQSTINAESTGVGEADEQGEISILSRDGSIRLLRGSDLSTRTESSGFAGPITVSASNGALRLQNSSISSDFGGAFTADGGAGEIALISAGTLRLQNSQISASSFSLDTTEDGSGSITLQTTDGDIILRNSRIATTTSSSGTAGEIGLDAPQGRIELIGNGDTDREGAFTEADQGIAGDINITANSLLVEQSAQISARTKTGTAGNININQTEARDLTMSPNPLDMLIVRDESSRITARARQNGGDAGVITINAQNMLIENGGLIEASSISGNIIDTTTDNIGSVVRLQNVETLALASGGQINVETARGRAGNVEINLTGLPVSQLYLDGASTRISARATAQDGASGTVVIHAQDIQIRNDARITAANRRNTNSRNPTSTTSTTSNSPQSISELVLEDVTSLQVLSGGQLSVRTRTGTAGNVEINQSGSPPLETLMVDGRGSRITARAIGQGGDAGQVAIDSRNVRVSDRARITAANVSSLDTAITDNIVLEQVETLEVLTGGELSVRTNTGLAGNVEINQDRSQPVTSLIVDGTNSSITAQAIRPGGSAGRVAINAQTVLVDNLGQITASNINAISTDPSNDSALSFTNVERLEVLNGGQISVLTQDGTAGNIAIDSKVGAPSPSIRVEGERSEITAQAIGTGPTTPSAGNITINTRYLNVSDGGSITVSSPTGVAGNLELNVPFIVLDDGQLSAEIGSNTASDTGAEISLSGLRSLLMRNNSLISASAINGATGGNLTFGNREKPVGFVGAPSNSNSDIIATAQQGQGGNITFRVAQIEGFTVRNTPFVRNNVTNDISASSAGGPQGSIILDTPSVNPLRSLTNLPGILVAIPPLGGLCHPQSQGQSEFVQVGRGGLPRHPEDILGPDPSAVPWVRRELTASPSDQGTAPSIPRDAITPHLASQPQTSIVNRAIIEAQGWMTDPQGNPVLTAHAPSTVTLDSSGAIAQNHCTP